MNAYEELVRRPAVELAALVRRREVSPVELVTGCLERIEALDGTLNSFVTVDPEGALAAARRAEAVAGEDGSPPFLGVPIGIKDGHLTKGMRTTFGSAAYASYVPDIDEENVARLRAAGFVFVGKTNLPEFGSLPYTEPRLHGPTRNPWDLGRTPGGSSGGAAAALAAGLIPVAHGSDGAGSIRIPASNCGVVGLKPARGRISSGPLFGDRLAGLSTAGPLAWWMEDLAAMLDVMAGYAPGDPHWAPPPERPFSEEVHEDPPRLRIGLTLATPLSTPTAEAVRVAEDAAALLERLGHAVEPVTLPIDAGVLAHFEVLWASGIAGLPVDPSALEPFNAALYERGHAASAGRLMEAVWALQLLARAVVSSSLHLDAVLSPTLARDPLRIGELTGLEEDADAMFPRLASYLGLTPIANLTGQPAISLPLGRSPDDLPMGVMLTGRPADEATLLRLGGQLQRSVGWTTARPRVGKPSATV